MGTLPSCRDVIMPSTVRVHGRGSVWYRLVGASLVNSNFTDDVESSVRFIAGQLNIKLVFGSYQQVSAPDTSVATGQSG